LTAKASPQPPCLSRRGTPFPGRGTGAHDRGQRTGCGAILKAPSMRIAARACTMQEHALFPSAPPHFPQCSMEAARQSRL